MLESLSVQMSLINEVVASMPLFNGLTRQQIIERQGEIFLRIPVKIDPFGSENQCYPNCVAKVVRDGGRVLTGWRRTCATVGAELAATLDHHAIWESTQGELTDISARVRVLNGQLEKVEERITYFMIDPAATFEVPNKARPTAMVIPLVEDTFGHLKRACGYMEAAIRARDSGDEPRALYSERKAGELLDRHLRDAKMQGLAAT
jgi:hypothetical protein